MGPTIIVYTNRKLGMPAAKWLLAFFYIEKVPITFIQKELSVNLPVPSDPTNTTSYDVVGPNRILFDQQSIILEMPSCQMVARNNKNPFQ